MPLPAISSISNLRLASLPPSSSADFLSESGKCRTILGAQERKEGCVYQPKISDEHIRQLYQWARRLNVPMTHLLNTLLDHALVRLEQGIEAMEFAGRPGVLKVLLTIE